MKRIYIDIYQVLYCQAMVHCQENFVYVKLCTIRQWCRNIGLSKFPFHYKWVRWYYYDNVTDDGDDVDDYREYNNEIEIDADNCHGRKRAGDVQQHLPKTTGKIIFFFYSISF